MRRAFIVAAVATVVVAGSASSAAADGLPLTDLGARPDGVATSGGDERYVTLRAGAGTVLARIARGSAEVLGSTFIAGDLTVPAVAYDGTAGGLSADGSVLALIKPRRAFPRASTQLALLDARRPRLRRRIRLDGDFSFDAISPDGSALFLVEYPNPRDPSVYRVRVYDVAAKRLLPEPLIDSRVAAVVMRGIPMTRATSPDGRVAYTLYDGFGKPFIHALDTEARSALCILLPKPGAGTNPMDLRLSMRDEGRQLAVIDAADDRPLALVDTATAKARRPGEAPPPDAGEQSSAVGLTAPIAAAALVLAGGWSLRRRR